MTRPGNCDSNDEISIMIGDVGGREIVLGPETLALRRPSDAKLCQQDAHFRVLWSFLNQL